MSTLLRCSSILLALYAPLGRPLMLGTARAEPSAALASPGVLLLRNQNVIQGKIRRDGDRFCVGLKGGEIFVRTSDVVRVASDLEELYQQQRLSIGEGQMGAHLRLADWCLRQGLLGYAALEISEVQKTEPKYPGLKTLSRRLDYASQRPAKIHQSHLPQNDWPSSVELDASWGQLNSESQETFTRKVQPLLLNHCSTAACHGSRSTNSLRLVRIPRRHNVTRRFTQRNLHTALRLVDQEDPDASPLLTKPVQPHGTAKAPVFAARDAAKYQLLVDWVHQIVDDKSSQSNRHVKLASEPAGQREAGDPPPGPHTQKRGTAQLKENGARISQASAMGPALKPPSNAYRPNDPFDPAIFNAK